jgi:hypothetical protein
MGDSTYRTFKNADFLSGIYPMGGIGSKTRRVNEEVRLVSRSDRLKMEFALAYKAAGVVFYITHKVKKISQNKLRGHFPLC